MEIIWNFSAVYTIYKIKALFYTNCLQCWFPADSINLCLVQSDRRDRWVTTGRTHCTAALHITTQNGQTESSGGRKIGDDRQIMTHEKLMRHRKNCNLGNSRFEQVVSTACSASWGRAQCVWSVLRLATYGTEQIPVTTNSTCIHHCREHLQSPVIFIPLCVSGCLPEFLNPLSLSTSKPIYCPTSRKWTKMIAD